MSETKTNPTALAVPQTAPAALGDKVLYARELANSGLLPTAYRKQPANVLWAYEYGQMLGLSPMAAITGIHVIEGKPTASAALISALVRRAGHRLRVTGDDTEATVEIVRCDDPEFTFRAVWTMQRAQQAGLSGKGVWKSYPAAMLKARAISECARDACEEALMGMHYVPEELGADVDEDGAPVDRRDSRPPEQAPEPDWDARIAEHEKVGDRDRLVALWRQAKAHRPDDADLLGRIAAAGARVAEATAEPETVDAELVDTDTETDASTVPPAESEPMPAVDTAAKRGTKKSTEDTAKAARIVVDNRAKAMGIDETTLYDAYRRHTGKQIVDETDPAPIRQFIADLDAGNVEVGEAAGAKS